MTATTIGKPYEPLSIDGEPTAKQTAAARQIKGNESVLLEDGRLRIYEIDADIIQAIHYVAPDGSVVTER